MFSKILIKLIDEAIVPALYLVTSRVVSLIFVAKYFDIPVRLGNKGFVYYSQADYLLVNSYSMLFMVFALCLGLLHVVVKSFMFHSTHIAPPLAAKLYSIKAQHLIQDSFHLYTQGLVWLAYLYLLTAGAGFMSFFGLMYSWVTYVSLGLAVLFTYIFIIDVEREMELSPERKR